jgi:hypothetical protein
MRLLSWAAEQFRIAVCRQGDARDEPEQQQAKVLHQWRPDVRVAETEGGMLGRNQKSGYVSMSR